MIQAHHYDVSIDHEYAKHNKLLHALTHERLDKVFSSSCVLFPPDVQQAVPNKMFATNCSFSSNQRCARRVLQSLGELHRHVSNEIDACNNKIRKLKEKACVHHHQ